MNITVFPPHPIKGFQQTITYFVPVPAYLTIQAGLSKTGTGKNLVA